MIETGIDLTPYKIVSLGGKVNVGKSFIMGLLVDELLAIGKNVCFINSEGSEIRFDASHPNVRCFVYWVPEHIIQFYEQMNSMGEEIYIFIDSIDSINFQYNSKSRVDYYREFILSLRRFENITTIFNYNFHTSITNSLPRLARFSDFNIDVRKKKIESVEFNFNMYLNENFLCKMSELCVDPKIRSRERKLSKLID